MLTVLTHDKMARHGYATADPSCTAGVLRHHLRLEQGRFRATLGALQLESAYQPIVGLCHERIVGYEALLRTTRNTIPCAPDKLFSEATSLSEIIQLDRLARLLHTINFSLSAQDEPWLFLNVHPQVFIHGRHFGLFFDDMLAHSALSPERLVIEVLEGEIDDEERLAKGVNYYRERGCLIALDDFGAHHSNIDRVLRLTPDIVKFDKSLLRRAALESQARRVLSRLVSLLHEAGIMVVIEGIETIEEALIALDSDADFGQGYLFARPESELVAATTSFDFVMLNRRLQQQHEATHADHDEHLQHQMALFHAAALQCSHGRSLHDISHPLFTSTPIKRTYLLDSDGHELATAIAPRFLATLRRQLTPLLQPHRSNWSRRPYFRAAINAPGTLQVTPPYRSISDRQMCRTLSLAIDSVHGTRVICADLAWRE